MSDSIPTIVFGEKDGLTLNQDHLKLHASLTYSDAEDWVVLPVGKKLLVYGLRERKTRDGTTTFWKGGWTWRSDFLAFLRRLQSPHDLGCVSIYVATDAEAAGTSSLVPQVAEIGRRKSFNILRMIVKRADTARCIRCLDTGTTGLAIFPDMPAIYVRMN